MDGQRHAQLVSARGLDAENVVQEERKRRRRIEAFADIFGMSFERFHGGEAVQADQAPAEGFCDSHRLRRRFPTMTDADADADWMGGDDLERDRGIGEHLRPVEDDRALELRIIAGAPAKQLVLRLGGDHQLLDQVGGMAGQGVGHDEGRAVKCRLFQALEARHDLARGRFDGGMKVTSDPDREADVLALQGQGARRAVALDRMGEFAGRRRADEQGAGTFRGQGREQRDVIVSRRREDDNDVGQSR